MKLSKPIKENGKYSISKSEKIHKKILRTFKNAKNEQNVRWDCESRAKSYYKKLRHDKNQKDLKTMKP